MSLPEKIRGVLEPFVEDLKSREIISGIGLFGSWSRGEAALGSDVDLLIVENRDFDYERMERIELNNCLIDLVYIPKSWIIYRIPTEVDQKIYELEILFDRDGSLRRAKDLMAKVYWKPERVDIRTESHLVEADVYLSRARLALNRGDYQSVKVNSIRSFRSLMKILLEIGRSVISNSGFIRSLESATKNLGMYPLYENYISSAGLIKLDKSHVKNMLNALLPAWREMISFVKGNPQFLKDAHPKISANINYYMREEFLKGLTARVNGLMEEATPIESAHYIYHTFIEALENYVYFSCLVEGIKFDYVTIISCLMASKKSPREILQGTVDVLGLRDTSAQDAERMLKSLSEAATNIRQKRKDLIARFIG